MRTLKFRDVLGGVAYRLGYDPTKTLINQSAIPIGTYITDAVKRYWPSIDWPEWTTIEARIPTNHIVPYSNPPSTEIGKVFKVYLVDPTTVRGPIDTPFKLEDVGIHCGFEHGRAVWIKFQKPPPRYTAVAWDATTLFNIGDLTYSPVTGECYASLVNGNVGNDPSSTTSTPISQQLTQSWSPGAPGLAAQSKIIEVTLPFPLSVIQAGTIYYVEISTAGSVTGSGSYTASGGETPLIIVNAVQAALVGDPGLSGFTITVRSSDFTILIEHASEFIVDNMSAITTPDSVKHPWILNQTQNYVPSVSPIAPTNQSVKIQLGSTQILPNADYVLTVTDTSGIKHSVSYQSQNNSAVDILHGIADAVTAGITLDPYWGGVFTSLDTASPSLTVSTIDPVSVDPTFSPMESVFWDYVPFPADLFTQVVRDAYANALRDRGQTDKAGTEEQTSGALEAEEVGIKYSPVVTPLTDQTKVISTYRNREPA